jgi:voltage-gated potassium channel
MNSSRHPMLRFRRPALLLLLVLLYGTLGYTVVEHWDPLDSFFMTVITLSTVGYGEVHRLSTPGKIFTVTLIVVGIGTMLYALGVFAEMLTDGDLAKWRRERRLESRVAALRDHFIICGYGRIGTRVLGELEREGMPSIAIDNSPDAVTRLRQEDRLFIEGDAASEEILQRAGISRARGLISAVDSDERAVYIALAARALRSDLYILARAGRPEALRRLELAGVNRAISPYRMAGHRMAEMALHPSVVEVMDTLQAGGGEIGVEEMLVPPECRRQGQTLEHTGLLRPGSARLLALRRSDGTLDVNPGPTQHLEAGDLLVVLGSSQEIDRTAALLQ